jgi:hypothetical protein
MAIFSSAARQPAAHQHVAGEHCPWCDQPIPHGKFEAITRRIQAREREQFEAMQLRLTAEFAQKTAALEARSLAAVDEARAQAVAAAEQRVQAARAEARQAADTAALSRVAEMQVQLAEAEQGRVAAHQEMAALKEAQEEALDARLSDALETLQRDRDAAVLAEKAKTLKLQSELADMQRKLEGKSAHELGEGSEIDLFEELRTAFEGDRIQRVPKGVNGADVIHEVVHNGKVCGKIIYDAKNRNAWQNEFASKLKADKLVQGADFAILSSNKFPREKAHVHNQDGVIVANPARVLALVEILRDQLVRMLELRVSNEARGTKMEDLYVFMTSEHCRQLIEQVEAQAGKMIELDAKEQEAHRRLWDQRAKLIRSVQKARGDLSFEIDRIIGTAGNGPEDAQ